MAAQCCPMAKCFFCGRVTVMYVAGEPVCLECSEIIDSGKKPGRREEKETPQDGLCKTSRMAASGRRD
jgi:hypothetical protein